MVLWNVNDSLFVFGMEHSMIPEQLIKDFDVSLRDMSDDMDGSEDVGLSEARRVLETGRAVLGALMVLEQVNVVELYERFAESCADAGIYQARK